MTPDTLEQIAVTEIETSRELMAALARQSSGAPNLRDTPYERTASGEFFDGIGMVRCEWSH